MTRVMLVDDHAVVREGYRRLIEKHKDLKVVAEAGDGQDAYRFYKEHKPEVVVLDLSMPGKGGIEVVRQFPLPLVCVMARPDSEREQYSTWAKRKDDAHFVTWAARNWINTPSKALPTARAVPGIAKRSLMHLVTRTKRVN